MPKKTRKMKERAAMRRAAMSQPGASETLAEGMRSTLAPSARTYTPPTFDYSHIYNDLKRIALFAGFFFAVLIGLSFVVK